MPENLPLYSLSPGMLPYGDALVLQERLLERRIKGAGDVLLLLEHPPVVTLGRGADSAFVQLSERQLKALGIELVRTGRGGEATYHGPGQLVGYPILHLDAVGRDIHRYLRLLEEVIIEAVSVFGIEARREPSRTGVWVGQRKIASIGVGVRRWVSWHGFAVNLEDQSGGFSTIVPCGLPGVKMTSLQELLGSAPSMGELEQAVLESFCRIFSRTHAGTYEDTH